VLQIEALCWVSVLKMTVALFRLSVCLGFRGQPGLAPDAVLPSSMGEWSPRFVFDTCHENNLSWCSLIAVTRPSTPYSAALPLFHFPWSFLLSELGERCRDPSPISNPPGLLAMVFVRAFLRMPCRPCFNKLSTRPRVCKLPF